MTGVYEETKSGELASNNTVQVPGDNNNLLGFIPSKFFWRTTSFCFHQPWMQYVNWLYFHYQRTRHNKSFASNITSFSDFYFIHNNIPNFYSVYEPNGFIEIQLLLPKAAAIEGFKEIVEVSKKNGLHPTLSGMKKALPDDFLISFQGEGISLSLDIPVKPFDLKELRTRTYPIYETVCKFNGKVNLSKDITISKDLFWTMYPNLTSFASILRKFDPESIFQNDMSRRLLHV